MASCVKESNNVSFHFNTMMKLWGILQSEQENNK